MITINNNNTNNQSCKENENENKNYYNNKCLDHPNKKYKTICVTCNKPVCLLCMTSIQYHRGHIFDIINHDNVKPIFDQFNEDIYPTLKEIQTSNDNILKESNRRFNSKLSQLQNYKSTVIIHLDEICHETNKIVKKEKEILDLEINELNKRNIQLHDDIESDINNQPQKDLIEPIINKYNNNNNNNNNFNEFNKDNISLFLTHFEQSKIIINNNNENNKSLIINKLYEYQDIIQNKRKPFESLIKRMDSLYDIKNDLFLGKYYSNYKNFDGQEIRDDETHFSISGGIDIKGKLPNHLNSILLLDEFDQGFNILPDGIQSLAISNISIQLEKESIPSSVQTLHLLGGFSQTLTPGVIPETIKELHIGDIKQPLTIGSIPKTIEKLCLDFGYNHTIEPYTIPESIKELYIGGINKSLVIGSIPNNVEKLYLGNGFNQIIIPELIPDSTKELHFGDLKIPLDIGSIPKGVERVYFKTFPHLISPGIIPESIKELTIGNIKQLLIHGSIPNNVKKLYLDNGFDQKLDPGLIPDSIKELHLGDIIKPLETGSIPNGVEKVSFERFPHLISPGIIPESIKELTIGNIKQSLIHGSIPNNLKKLYLDNGFNQKLDPGLIPASIKELHLGNIVQPLVEGSIPNTIKKLYLDNGFNHLITPWIIPGSTRVLFVNDIKQPLIIGSIPNTINVLHFDNGFNHTLNSGIIPETIKTLYINYIKQPLEIGSIPNNLEKLYLRKEFTQIKTPGIIPDSVKELYIDMVKQSKNQLQLNTLPSITNIFKKILIMYQNQSLIQIPIYYLNNYGCKKNVTGNNGEKDGKPEKKSVALDLYGFYKKFQLKEKFTLNHNSRIFRFSLPNENDILGLQIGQHISLRALVDGKVISRPFTPISSNDAEGFFDLLIKIYEKGAMSSHLDKMFIGDYIEVSGPKGKFDYKQNMCKSIGMLAGGTGITPMLQIIISILKNPNDKTEISLIFGNITEEDILLKKELDELSSTNSNFKVYYVLNNPPKGWAGGVGFISQEIIRSRLPAPSDDTMIINCGPPMMKMAMAGHLKSIGFIESNIFTF